MRKRISTTDLSQIEPRRVCLVKPSALGDVVQTLPVLGALHRRWPDASFAWVVNKNLRALLEGHPCLDEIIEFDRGCRGISGMKAAIHLARRLKSGDFDLTCDLQGLLRSGLMTRATRAPVRVGLSTAREQSHRFYTHEVPVPDPNLPAVDRYMLLAETFGAGEGERRFDVPVPREAVVWAEEQCASLPRRLLAIHPGARWMTKRWPAEHFAAIAARAQREFGVGVVVVGSPDERELAGAVVGHLPNGHYRNLAGKTSLKQLAAVLSRADLLVSNDSGPMHLAAAVGTPVVGVFTCTSPRRAGPYGAGHRVVATSVDCAASYLKQCDRLDCMRQLTPEGVWPCVAEMLEAMGG